MSEPYDAARDLFDQVIRLRAALDVAFNLLALGKWEQAMDYLRAIIDANAPKPDRREP